MSKEPYYRTGRDWLRTTGTQVVLQYQINVRLILISVPFMFIFRAVGAVPMVAMFANSAVGLLGGVPWLLPKGFTIDVHTQRGVMLAAGGMLLVACGVQVLTWRLELPAHTSGVLLILCTIGLAVFLLIEGARATLQWAWQQI